MAQSAPMQSSQLAALLTPGLRGILQSELTGMESLFKGDQLLKSEPSTRAFEELQTIGAMNADGWDFRRAGEVSYEGISLGYKTTFKHRPFSKGIAMDREAVEDNLYSESGLPTSLNGVPVKLAMAVKRQQEKQKADILNGGFTDSGTRLGGFSYAGSDSVGLLSLVHPYSPSNTASTQANEGTLSLSEANYDTTRQYMRSFTDDQGELVAIDPSDLWVPAELETTARKLAESMQEYATANNAKNVVGGTIKNVYVWDYLTDATAWFVVDPVLAAQCAKWFNRTGTEFKVTYDGDRHVYKSSAYWRSSCGWSDWRWIFGQNG